MKTSRNTRKPVAEILLFIQNNQSSVFLVCIHPLFGRQTIVTKKKNDTSLTHLCQHAPLFKQFNAQ